MTSDRNPKPMRFIQPNALDRAGLSVGKDDGLADQFGLPRSVLIQNIFHRMALHVQIAIPATRQTQKATLQRPRRQ
jgi:hypothetical protein